MKSVGYGLIAAGFLAGSLVSVVHAEHVARVPLGIALAVGFAGVAMVRMGRNKAAGEHEKLAGDVQQLGILLERITASIAGLREAESEIGTYDMRHRIDSVLAADVHSFAEGRHSIAAAGGLAAYADVMGHFAAGERYLNRAWSASADGYADEVNTCMARSQEEFALALGRLKNAVPDPGEGLTASPA